MSKQKNSFLCLASLATLLLAGFVVWYFQRDPVRLQPAPIAQSPAQTKAKALAATNPPSEIPEAPVEVPAAAPEEIAATARMYDAHAPLRTPEISDPDSVSNKQILQTMVSKALVQPAQPPPSAAVPNP